MADSLKPTSSLVIRWAEARGVRIAACVWGKACPPNFVIFASSERNRPKVIATENRGADQRVIWILCSLVEFNFIFIVESSFLVVFLQ